MYLILEQITNYLFKYSYKIFYNYPPIKNFKKPNSLVLTK